MFKPPVPRASRFEKTAMLVSGRLETEATDVHWVHILEIPNVVYMGIPDPI